VVPSAILGLAGTIAMETRIAAVTVRVTGAEVTAPRLAVTVVAPGATEVASPVDPAVLLTVATDSVPEAHLTWAVKFCVEWLA
jgi:hypothetical protein